MKRSPWPTRDAGFSLIEMTIVVGIGAVLTAAAVIQIGMSRPNALADGAMRVVLSQMNAAREAAITQRRCMRMTFTNSTVTTIREEVPGPTLTQTTAVPFEGGIRFLTATGVPDTPEPYGNSTAVVFTNATGTPPEVKFSPEGTFINQDGVPLNGTIFLSIPNKPLSARAVSIFGSTGRIRGYRWNGNAWKPV